MTPALTAALAALHRHTGPEMVTPEAMKEALEAADRVRREGAAQWMDELTDEIKDILILLENDIALGRKSGMAGQYLSTMCSARDSLMASGALILSLRAEVERLREAEARMRSTLGEIVSVTRRKGTPSVIVGTVSLLARVNLAPTGDTK